MLYILIVVCVAAGAGAVYLACAVPDKKRFRRAGYGLLTVSVAGFIGLCTGMLLYFLKHTGENDSETLLQMFMATSVTATAVCTAIVLGTVFTGKRLIRLLPVLVPFLWMVPLLLWTDLCASLTDKPGMILTLGISLCALLFLCPAAAFLRAAALLKQEEPLQQRLDEIASKKQKRNIKRKRRMQKRRLRSPGKYRATK